jgi:hypothetical protein
MKLLLEFGKEERKLADGIVEEFYTKAREERGKKNSSALITINVLDKENKIRYINLMKEKYEKSEWGNDFKRK